MSEQAEIARVCSTLDMSKGCVTGAYTQPCEQFFDGPLVDQPLALTGDPVSANEWRGICGLIVAFECL